MRAYQNRWIHFGAAAAIAFLGSLGAVSAGELDSDGPAVNAKAPEAKYPDALVTVTSKDGDVLVAEVSAEIKALPADKLAAAVSQIPADKFRKLDGALNGATPPKASELDADNGGARAAWHGPRCYYWGAPTYYYGSYGYRPLAYYPRPYYGGYGYGYSYDVYPRAYTSYYPYYYQPRYYSPFYAGAVIGGIFAGLTFGIFG